MRRIAALLALVMPGAACDDAGGGVRIGITLDVPAAEQNGELLGALDTLQFRVSDGNDFLTTQLYKIEDGVPAELILPEVPLGNRVVFDLSGLAGTARVAYGRTCRLAINDKNTPEPARLYFARVGTFYAGQEPIEPARVCGQTFADARGRAIVTGGAESPVVELFDPREGTFDQAGESLIRADGAIAVRSDGTAVVAGGIDEVQGGLVGAVEEIDPISQLPEDQVHVLGPAIQPAAERTGLALAPLPLEAGDTNGGGVLLTGGRNAAGKISDEIAILADSDDEFRPIETKLAKPRTGHTASLGLGGVVYLIGGLSPEPDGPGEFAVGSIELFRPQDKTIRTLSAKLQVPRYGHTATVLADGSILIVGGKVPGQGSCGGGQAAVEDCFEAVGEVEVFDPVVGEVHLVDLKIEGGIYDHSATLVGDGRVLIAGGFDRNREPRAQAWLFDPGGDLLGPTRELTSPRAGHTATQLCDDTVLLVGGVSVGEMSLPAERYIPALLDRP